MLARDSFPWIPEQGEYAGLARKQHLCATGARAAWDREQPEGDFCSALRSEADTSIYNCAYKDAALLLLNNLYTCVLDVVLCHYID